MRRAPWAGRNNSSIVAKTIGHSLADDRLNLPYNWPNKVRGVVLGICLSQSTVLQSIARALDAGGPMKKIEKALSEFLGFKKLELRPASRKHTVKTLRRMGLKRFYLYRGKLVLIVDATSYAKMRSRGKKRGMPLIGKIVLHNVPTKEKVLAPGYMEFWAGLLLKEETCLGITRRLYSEKKLPEIGFSQNALEEDEIRSAIELVKEAFGMGVILIADRGFRRKDLLAWLKNELRADFVIRIEGNLTVKARGWKGLLKDLAPRWRERLRRHWRDDSKEPIMSEVRGEPVAIPLDSKGKDRVRVNVVHLTPIHRENMDPMFLATTLPIETRASLSRVVSLYSKRWTLETFFARWKQSLGAGAFRVFSCWNAIDQLLTMAHMALLVLYLLYILGKEATRGTMAELWRRLESLMLRWVARPPEITLGQFFVMLAMASAPTRLRWALQ